MSADLKEAFGPLKPEIEAAIDAVDNHIRYSPHSTELVDLWESIVNELRVTSEVERIELPAKVRYLDELRKIDTTLDAVGIEKGPTVDRVQEAISDWDVIHAARLVNPDGWSIQLRGRDGFSGPPRSFYDDKLTMTGAIQLARMGDKPRKHHG